MYRSQRRRLKLSIVLATTIVSISFAVFAQDESEVLPTLRLDRIPSSPAFLGQTRAAAAKKSTYSVETVASGLSAPWALAFLPDGEILINEYVGNMRILDANGRLSEPLRGLPEMSHEGWAGLFDVALDPEFAENQLVYFSFTGKPRDPDGKNIPRVGRGRLDRANLQIVEVEIIIDGPGSQEIHFAPDGKLLVSGAGDVFKDNAQDLGITFGKLLRFNPDGSVPGDNPWSEDSNVHAAIFSLGHRDISGFASHPDTGETWITEHSARGGDELNRIRAGANYGWKIISFGTEYSGAPIGDGITVRDGMEQPRYFWRPSIAPSGLVFYTGNMFPEWRGNIFVTSLAGQHLSRLVLDGDRVVAEERLLVARAERIREARVGPDGALYVLTNEESDVPRGTAELLRIYRN
jgi:glucose/arabinose dehydrogenase